MKRAIKFEQAKLIEQLCGIEDHCFGEHYYDVEYKRNNDQSVSSTIANRIKEAVGKTGNVEFDNLLKNNKYIKLDFVGPFTRLRCIITDILNKFFEQVSDDTDVYDCVLQTIFRKTAELSSAKSLSQSNMEQLRALQNYLELVSNDKNIFPDNPNERQHEVSQALSKIQSLVAIQLKELEQEVTSIDQQAIEIKHACKLTTEFTLKALSFMLYEGDLPPDFMLLFHEELNANTIAAPARATTGKAYSDFTNSNIGQVVKLFHTVTEQQKAEIRRRVTQQLPSIVEEELTAQNSPATHTKKPLPAPKTTHPESKATQGEEVALQLAHKITHDTRTTTTQTLDAYSGTLQQIGSQGNGTWNFGALRLLQPTPTGDETKDRELKLQYMRISNETFLRVQKIFTKLVELQVLSECYLGEGIIPVLLNLGVLGSTHVASEMIKQFTDVIQGVVTEIHTELGALVTEFHFDYTIDQSTQADHPILRLFGIKGTDADKRKWSQNTKAARLIINQHLHALRNLVHTDAQAIASATNHKSIAEAASKAKTGMMFLRDFTQSYHGPQIATDRAIIAEQFLSTIEARNKLIAENERLVQAIDREGQRNTELTQELKRVQTAQQEAAKEAERLTREVESYKHTQNAGKAKAEETTEGMQALSDKLISVREELEASNEKIEELKHDLEESRARITEQLEIIAKLRSQANSSHQSKSAASATTLPSGLSVEAHCQQVLDSDTSNVTKAQQISRLVAEREQKSATEKTQAENKCQRAEQEKLNAIEESEHHQTQLRALQEEHRVLQAQLIAERNSRVQDAERHQQEMQQQKQFFTTVIDRIINFFKTLLRLSPSQTTATIQQTEAALACLQKQIDVKSTPDSFNSDGPENLANQALATFPINQLATMNIDQLIAEKKAKLGNIAENLRQVSAAYREHVYHPLNPNHNSTRMADRFERLIPEIIFGDGQYNLGLSGNFEQEAKKIWENRETNFAKAQAQGQTQAGDAMEYAKAEIDALYEGLKVQIQGLLKYQIQEQRRKKTSGADNRSFNGLLLAASKLNTQVMDIPPPTYAEVQKMNSAPTPAQQQTFQRALLEQWRTQFEPARDKCKHSLAAMEIAGISAGDDLRNPFGAMQTK